MLERLYECFGTEERIGLICHINGMEMGWMNFVIENIYEEGDAVRVETGDSYIRLEPKLYEEVPAGEGAMAAILALDAEGKKFVHGKDYIILYKMEEEECF